MVDCEAEGFLHMDESKSKAQINKFQFYLITSIMNPVNIAKKCIGKTI